MTAEQLSVPPPPHVVPEQRFAHAGLGARAIAFLIDLLIVALVTTPLGLLFDAGLPNLDVLGGFSLAGLLTYAGIAAYFVVTTATTGGTLGKHALGLRVVTTDLTRPDWTTVLFREVVGRIIVTATAFVGYIWIAVDPRKQGWHDRIADTLVVQRVAVLETGDPWASERPAPAAMRG